MGLIKNFWNTVLDALTQPPYATPCTGDCNQGRDCTCCSLEQRRHQLDDDYYNNWPFPVGPKP